MILLLLFSFLAGIITIMSPCILSVLPILLSATSDQTKYKPLGIIIGLILSFSFFTLATMALVKTTGISPDLFRYIAAGTIIFFGLTMVVPSIDAWFSTFITRATHAGTMLQTQSITIRNALLSGLVLGAALGLIWTPCAGPILATITALASTQGITLTTLLMMLAYSCGAALPMLVIMYGGNFIINTTQFFTPYMPIIRKFFGIVMIITALTIAFNKHTQLESIFARFFPTLTIETNPLIEATLQSLKKGSTHHMQTYSKNTTYAPELVGITDWINSTPLTLEKLRGKVVLLDFWTYSCINCIRTLPHLKEWYTSYKDKGFEIIGIHTPEFAFEKNVDHVRAAANKFGITYPIALDNNYATWQAYDNHYWPAHYLIDKNGDITYHHFGEGDYLTTENKIRQLLGLWPRMTGKMIQKTPNLITPEIYLGYARADRYDPDIIIKKDAVAPYNYKQPLPNDYVGLTGAWLIKTDYIQSANENCTISLNFIAHTVNLVMESPTPQEISLLLDGKPVPPINYTSDTNSSGTITVHEPRMYNIIDLKEENGRHILMLTFPKNVSVYVFTFG